MTLGHLSFSYFEEEHTLRNVQMSPQHHNRDIFPVGTGFPETLSALQAPTYPLERLSRRQQGEQHGPLMGTQKNEYNMNSSFVAPDNRLLLSPSSSSSQYSIPSSSIFSSVYPDHSSQSTYPRSPEEFYQPAYPRAERVGTNMSTSFSDRRLSMALQEESYPDTRHTGRRRSGIPLGFDRLLNPSEQTSHPAERAMVNNHPSRLRLHIRQQPIATRACSAGEKDRRTIDPPPILQLLITDFRPDSKTDMAMLQNSRLAVACLLYSVGKPGPDGKEVLVHSSQVVETTRRRHRDDGRAHNTYRVDSRTTRHINEQSDQSDQRPVQILSGRTYVSPFITPYDPDLATAPYQYQQQHHTTRPPPATFFVFADLSVRTAGVYRLKFRLLDWGLAQETGKPQPILAEIFSEPFRVYSSKDFPGMRASSALTWNLRKMGMTELKPRDGKGKGVAKKEKRSEDD